MCAYRVSGAIALSAMLLAAAPPTWATATAVQEPTDAAQDGEQLQLRGGTLVIAGEPYDMWLKLGDRPLTVPDGNALSIVEAFAIGDSDVVLVMKSSGGEACPAEYLFVSVGARGGATVSPTFGTCSDLVEAKQNGDAIAVNMPEYRGPAAGEAEQRRAAGKKHVFLYRAGRLTDNGREVK